MKKIYLLIILYLTSVNVFAQTGDAFEIRGVLPWHNFLSGPSVWNESDYKTYLDRCAQQGINFIGFHNYTGGGERYATYVEPMIKITYKGIVPAACFDNSLTARWGYLPLAVKDFAYGTSGVFQLPHGASAFGSDASVLSKGADEHYARSQALMQSVLKMAHQRGIEMAMGFEFGVLPPEYFSLNGFYWPGEANLVPDPTHETAIELHYAALDNILGTYPGIDYIWLWLNEHCFMGVDAAKAIAGGSFGAYYKEHESLFEGVIDEKSRFIGVWALKYMQLTQEYLAKKAPGVKIILGGWGGGNQLPSLMKGLDKGLPTDVIFTCLNPGLGTQAQPGFLGEIARNRKVWAIPWLEGDHQLWHLQPRVELMKEHVQLAAQQKLNGVAAIHWRTEETRLNMEAFSLFARQPASSKSTKDIYREYINANFGKNAQDLLNDLVRWDTEQLNGGRGFSSEYFAFDTNWGILDEKALDIRNTISKKIAVIIPKTNDKNQLANLQWLKNTIDFELLLHQTVKAMQPAALLKRQHIENGKIPTSGELDNARKALVSAPVEQLFRTYAARVRSRGEMGVLSSLNQKLWTNYKELQSFLNKSFN